MVFYNLVAWDRVDKYWKDQQRQKPWLVESVEHEAKENENFYLKLLAGQKVIDDEGRNQEIEKLEAVE